jgi:asparagine synthase (glutamine-hydrolysing)
MAKVRMDFAGAWLPAANSGAAQVGWPEARLGDSRVQTLRTAQSLLAIDSASVAPTMLGEADAVSVCLVGAPRWTHDALEARRSHGDVVGSLLEGWQRFGATLLEHLRGPFSIALVDAAARTVLLASDRFGIHPVAWAKAGDGIVFASHVGAIRAHPALDGAALDEQAIYDYLHFHVVPAPGSIYQGVGKLRAGERLLWQDGAIDVSRYWEPAFAGAGAAVDVPALQQAMRQALDDGVARATASNGRTASFLSGGLDSSSVSGMLARQHPDRPVSAYTMGFEADGFDEMAYARIAARHFGIDLRERYIEPDEVADAMPRVAAWYDEPFGNSSAVPAFVCASTAAQDGIDRLLAGDGGDELFAGNSRYVRQQLFSYYDTLPGAAQALLQRALLLDREGRSPLRRLPGLSKLVSYVDQARPGMPARYDSYNYLVRYGPSEVLTSQWLRRIDSGHPLALMQEVWARAPTDNLLQRMLYLDWQFTLADNDLRKVSEMCAAAGIGVRYPMLDDAVLDLSLQVPPNELIRGHRLRHFFKEAMTGYLPREIIDKKKHGFGLPFGDWLNRSEALRDVVFPALHTARERGFVNPAFIDKMILAHREGNANYYGGMLWVIVMLELWLSSHGHG